MKVDWSNWDTGGKTIFAASCVAISSMFLNWVDIGIVSASGMQQDAWLFLALWVYPALMLLNNKPIHRTGGLICSVVSIIGVIWYISSKSAAFMGQSINAASTGAWVFLVASVALTYGVCHYAPVRTTSDSAGPDSDGTSL